MSFCNIDWQLPPKGTKEERKTLLEKFDEKMRKIGAGNKEHKGRDINGQYIKIVEEYNNVRPM